ncbi:hypothetical protein A3A93_06470 [Candidatus Roizmanbacteria bacterium RIFCSPLOWO2_01_FULL_38_12]|uniref:Glycosyl transferase family 1 domain-containing protein n=1 Tax=Candidatus Roizmanbacteria bacterium RIFCSPLOWO2_01_FULL_38_12 TaxID=1802061 RepID=A0A1F7IU23_9BACT|nr:MAG: hypothetical protein A3A93_06470 [Candidatus Roizmanbacteria bacterium RIFCSPLOWO2_01_FULL_38_12]
MKIGIDISMLVYQGSGVATYTYNLVKNLLKIDKQNSYHLFYSSFRRPKNFIYLKELKETGGKIYDYPFPPRVMKFCWNKYHILPVEWLIGKVDIFHSSDFLRPPLLKGTKGITTIHDLTWKKFPKFHTKDIVKAHEQKLKMTIEKNDVIIVDSEKTKEDLLYYYPIVKNPIYTVPLGVDKKFFQRQELEKIRKTLNKYEIHQPYILYVGAIEPRKNIPTLIKAFNLVLKDYSNYKLVLAGRAGWKNEGVFNLINELDLNGKVIFTGFVEDEDLPAVYQGATVFVYPTFYEGFGLPPLEALASGTPTIAFNSPSLNIKFIEKIDPIELASKITSQIKNPRLLNLTIPSWTETSRKTLEVYRKIIRD